MSKLEETLQGKACRLTANSRANDVLWNCSNTIEQRYIQSESIVPSLEDYLSDMKALVESEKLKFVGEDPAKDALSELVNNNGVIEHFYHRFRRNVRRYARRSAKELFQRHLKRTIREEIEQYRQRAHGAGYPVEMVTEYVNDIKGYMYSFNLTSKHTVRDLLECYVLYFRQMFGKEDFDDFVAQEMEMFFEPYLDYNIPIRQLEVEFFKERIKFLAEGFGIIMDKFQLAKLEDRIRDLAI